MSPRDHRILNEGVLRAMAVCLEGMPVDAFHLLGRGEVRRLLVLYVHQFAQAHGVILTDEEILYTLDGHVRTQRASSEITPIGHAPATHTTPPEEQQP